MLVFLILIFALCLYKIKIIKPAGGINPIYIDREHTTSVNGIFILLVMLSHIQNSIGSAPGYGNDILNRLYQAFQYHIKQGVVVTFLFYSGYGIMESVRKKGMPYINSIPGNRIPKALLNYDLAVVLYIILGLILGSYKSWTVPQVLLSFTAWDSVGQSNWYIFAILCMYLATYIALKIGGQGKFICRFAAHAFGGLYSASLFWQGIFSAVVV